MLWTVVHLWQQPLRPLLPHRCTVNLLDDFRFDNAPDPRVALGKDGTYAPETVQTAVLEQSQWSGASSWELPAGVNPDDYNEVWIWCERFSVGLAIATAQ